MRIPLLAIILASSSLLLITSAPTALAGTDTVIAVADNNTYSRSFPREIGPTTYQFALKEPFFNFTNSSSNETVWAANVLSGIEETSSSRIKSTKHYDIYVAFNDTWSVRYTTDYIKHSFGRWSRGYHFTLFNGSDVSASCSSEGYSKSLIFAPGGIQPPKPWLKFSYSIHSRYAANPSLDISFGDGTYGQETCNLPGSIGGGIGIIMEELTAPPSIQFAPLDYDSYNYDLSYQFDTKKGEIASRDNFNIDNGQNCVQTFIFFGLCDIQSAFVKAISFLFSFIKSTALLFMGLIPFLGDVASIIAIPLDLMMGGAIVLANLLFLSSDTVGFGGMLWMTLVYASSWGLLSAALTANYVHIFLFPYFLIVGLVKAIAIFFWLIFVWIPERMANLVSNLFPK